MHAFTVELTIILSATFNYDGCAKLPCTTCTCTHTCTCMDEHKCTKCDNWRLANSTSWFSLLVIGAHLHMYHELSCSSSSSFATCTHNTTCTCTIPYSRQAGHTGYTCTCTSICVSWIMYHQHCKINCSWQSSKIPVVCTVVANPWQSG